MAAKTGGPKTNAMRELEHRGIPYEAHLYDPAITSADGVASAFGVPPSTVYKTLVMLRDANTPILVMATGDREVNLRSLARSIGGKSVRMAPKADAERLTGLKTGGIGALALLGKGFEVYVDRRIAEIEFAFVNAGRRGINLRLHSADLVKVSGARYVDVDESRPEAKADW